jgi:rRNA maturation endonuclease Nob1
MKNFSDFLYNKFMGCRHIYEIVNQDICPDCGRYTHETNFKEIADLHKQWIADGKADWSICKECGGTIRGWWSI